MKSKLSIEFIAVCLISLQVFLLGLKLLGVVSWPYWGVFFPIWLPLLTCIIIGFCMLIWLFGYAMYVAFVRD